MSVRDTIMSKTQQLLFDHDALRVPFCGETKGFTVRIDENILIGIEVLADELGLSRNSIIETFINESFSEAVSGYGDAHGSTGEHCTNAIKYLMEKIEQRIKDKGTGKSEEVQE